MHLCIYDIHYCIPWYIMMMCNMMMMCMARTLLAVLAVVDQIAPHNLVRSFPRRRLQNHLARPADVAGVRHHTYTTCSVQ